MLVHVPRDWVHEYKGEQFLRESERLYICWLGEPIEKVWETHAWAKSITREKKFYVVNCTKQE